MRFTSFPVSMISAAWLVDAAMGVTAARSIGDG
jgi:hypothetical protein